MAEDGGYDLSNYSGVVEAVNDGLNNGDNWPEVYKTLTAAGADPDLVDKALKVATGHYQPNQDNEYEWGPF